MKTVLITGGIGSGKSQVAQYIASRGYPVYDSDSRTKLLYEEVPGLKTRIEQAVGLPFCDLRKVFSDPSRREALEELVYPLVLEDFKRWREEQTSAVVFMESAVAMQKPQFRDLFDEVVLVTAPEFMRIRRVMSRDHSDRRSVIDRIKTQSPFAPHSYQIPNISDLQSLYNRTDKFLEKYEN